MAMFISLAPAAEKEKERLDEPTAKVVQSARDLQKEKKYQEAEALLTKTIADGNDHISLHMVLAVNYAAQKDYKKASELYQKAWNQTQDVNMLESYAVTLLQLKDVDGLRKITEPLVTNFDKLKEGRLAVIMVATADGDQNLFNRAIVKIPVEELKNDKQLASILVQAARKIAGDNLKEKE
jgi:tetratricopeptide (TPR) repeat protein